MGFVNTKRGVETVSRLTIRSPLLAAAFCSGGLVWAQTPCLHLEGIKREIVIDTDSEVLLGCEVIKVTDSKHVVTDML